VVGGNHYHLIFFQVQLILEDCFKSIFEVIVVKSVFGSKSVIALLLTISLCGTAWAAPDLDMGSDSARPGEEVTIPIFLTNETGTVVAGASTDITYNSEHLTPVDATIGPAGSAAGKEVVKNIVEQGLYRIGILSTSNVTPIPDGLVANVIFRVNSGAPAGIYQLGNNPNCSTPEGTPVATAGGAGIIEVNSSTTTSEIDDSPNSTTIPAGVSTTTTTAPASSTTTISSATTTAAFTTTTTAAPSFCSLIINPSAVNVVAKQAVNFAAQLTDAACAPPQLHWSVESSIGSTIDENGNYVAGENDAGADATDTILVVDYANGTGARALVNISGVPAGGISSISPVTITSSRWRQRLHLLVIHTEQGGLKMSSRLSFNPAGAIRTLSTLASGNTMIALVSVKPNVQGHYDVMITTGNTTTYTKKDGLTVNMAVWALDYRTQ
jgi:hypothetical protein